MDVYTELERLKKLLDDGTIRREEFEREKALLFSMNSLVLSSHWGLRIDEKIYVALMHASQFLSAFFVPFVAPLLMWVMFKDKSRFVNETGKNILNFQISISIYCLDLLLTCVGIVLIPFIGIASVVFTTIAIIKAFNGELWSYPLTIRFIK